jgi:hypothetical protein
VGAVDGITLFDKVIQTRNRPKSNPIWAYDSAKRQDTSKNSRYRSAVTKLPANDSASFPFRFINVHCRVVRDWQREQFFEVPISSLLDARRRENAQTPQINSFLFSLHIAKDALIHRRNWYEAGKIHESLSGDMLRSKSEVIIANQLHDRNIPFRYEQPLFAGDGTLRLPDFTVTWKGKRFSGSTSVCWI